jgi:hypothetical protein
VAMRHHLAAVERRLRVPYPMCESFHLLDTAVGEAEAFTQIDGEDP